MKYGKILALDKTFTKIFKATFSDVDLMFNLAEVRRACRMAIEDVQEIIQKLQKDHCEFAENGTFKHLKDGLTMDALNAKLHEAQEVEVPDFPKLKLTEKHLRDYMKSGKGDVTFTAEDIDSIMEIIRGDD